MYIYVHDIYIYLIYRFHPKIDIEGENFLSYSEFFTWGLCNVCNSFRRCIGVDWHWKNQPGIAGIDFETSVYPKRTSFSFSPKNRDGGRNFNFLQWVFHQSTLRWLQFSDQQVRLVSTHCKNDLLLRLLLQV